MAKTMKVKPAGGAPVRYEDASRGFIPDAGATVPATSYYRRRVAEGALVEPPARKRPPAKQKPKPKEAT